MSTLLITNAGINYKDAVFSGAEAQNITKFVFANVPGLQESDQISENATVPTQYIVDEQPVNRVSSLDDNAVVISCALGHEIGDYDFNWYGAIAVLADNTEVLIAVVHTNTQTKTKTAGATVGNYSVKSIVWRSSAIAASLNVTLSTLPWQVDDNAFVSKNEFEAHNHNGDHENFYIEKNEIAIINQDRLHVFTHPADLQIPSTAGTCFDFIVDAETELTTANKCRLLAPSGKKIIMKKVPYNSIDIRVKNIRHTVYKNNNGDWKL